MVTATYAVAEQQVQFFTDRANRIAATDFLLNFNRFSDRETLTLFGFRVDDINTLVRIIAWPWVQTCRTRSRYAVSPTLATCIILRRMAVSDRSEDRCYRFGKHHSQMSLIVSFCMHMVQLRDEDMTSIFTIVAV